VIESKVETNRAPGARQGEFITHSVNLKSTRPPFAKAHFRQGQVGISGPCSGQSHAHVRVGRSCLSGLFRRVARNTISGMALGAICAFPAMTSTFLSLFVPTKVVILDNIRITRTAFISILIVPRSGIC